MSVQRFAQVLAVAGTIALTYVCSADPQMEITAQAPSLSSAKAEISAQNAVARGRWKAGGSVGFTRSPDWGSSFNIAPSAQYFLVDRVAVGLEGSFSGSEGTVYYKSLRPSATVYLYAKDELAVFLKQDIGYNVFHGSYFDASIGSDNSYDSNYVDASTRLGLDWFLNQHVAITPMFGAQYGHYDKPVYSGVIALSVYL